jgi:hypothetical protein
MPGPPEPCDTVQKDLEKMVKVLDRRDGSVRFRVRRFLSVFRDVANVVSFN